MRNRKPSKKFETTANFSGGENAQATPAGAGNAASGDTGPASEESLDGRTTGRLSTGRRIAAVIAFVFVVGIILTGSFQQPLGSLGYVPPKITEPSINDFTAEYSLDSAGTASIDLRFVFEPGTEPQTGPVLKIPVQVATNNTAVDRVYPLGDVAVTGADGASVSVRTTEADGVKTLFIGTNTEPVTSATSYRVQYEQKGVITHLADHDVFSWSPIDDLDMGVKNAAIAVAAPAPATSLTCSSGSASSAWPCYQSTVSVGEAGSTGSGTVATELTAPTWSSAITENAAVVRNSVVPAGNSLLVSLNYPKGTFGDSIVFTASPTDRITPWSIWMAIVDAWQAFTATPIVFWGAVVALAALGRWVVTRRVFGAVPASHRASRPRGSARLTAPPPAVAPWAIGLMTDRLVTRYDVAAMVVELARRGIIEITNAAPRATAAHGDWTFELVRPGDSSLSSAERELIVAMFATGTVVRLDELVGDDWSRSIQGVRIAIVAETTTNPWFRRDTATIRRVVTIAGWVVSSLAIVPVFVIGATGDIGYVIAFVALISAGAILLSQGHTVFRRRRPPLSTEGEAVVADAQAYADHLADVDRGVAESTDRKRDLPFAVSLDVVGTPDRWVSESVRASGNSHDSDGAGSEPAGSDWTEFAVDGAAAALVTPHSLDLLRGDQGRNRTGVVSTSPGRSR